MCPPSAAPPPPPPGQDELDDSPPPPPHAVPLLKTAQLCLTRCEMFLADGEGEAARSAADAALKAGAAAAKAYV